MSTVRTYPLAVLVLLVLAVGCSTQKPGRPVIRFYPTWPESKLSQAWEGAGTSLDYESLGDDDDGWLSTHPFGTRAAMRYDISDFRAFTVIVRGRLPQGDIDIRANRIAESGAREKVYIAPRIISDEPFDYLGSIAWREVRTEEDLSAFSVRGLNPNGAFTLPEILPGRYYISLVKGGRALCGSDLTINRAAGLPALPLSRPWKD
jgi:hypothetical protein